MLLSFILPFSIKNYSQNRKEENVQDSMKNDYGLALKRYTDKDCNKEGIPSCANPKECIDFTSVIKSFLDGTVSLSPEDTTVAFTESMMDKTSYPPCPADISQSLYDLMIMQLDEENFYVDTEHYLRLEDIISMAKKNRTEYTQEKESANCLLDYITKECREYKGANITDKKIREITIANIRDLGAQFTGFINDKLSDKKNEEINKRIYMRKLSSAEYQKVYVDTTWHYSYIFTFKSYCASVESRFSQMNYNKWSANMVMGTLCMLQREPYVNNQCVEAILASKEQDYHVFGIKLLEHIMDSGRYSQWLPLVWKRWRYLYGMEYCSPSKDGIIPNWYYNNRKLQVYSTILRYLKQHPDDIDARTAACFLLFDSNIHIYGAFPYGNQLVAEDFLSELSCNHKYEE